MLATCRGSDRHVDNSPDSDLRGAILARSRRSQRADPPTLPGETDRDLEGAVAARRQRIAMSDSDDIDAAVQSAIRRRPPPAPVTP